MRQVREVRDRSIPGKGKNQCKGPKMGEGLKYLRNSEELRLA